ncbi:MAG: indolepyruvate oxidoreductase subunit beta [Candidatus Riflebacteria bacterium]|jgi:indolepyruvate ferredoxin oxidoreductase beta subunit|nr:indolepyruvate oxidoreductase subunit beta [Candidatus Riflebacteria bacterium]MDD3377083.1 indolepyruvate oxidoreductase subunit beta [Candidatus Riflebacteria bacterium]NCB46263.1 indolepyruvate oxidoreductase subunit beta [bacterium]NLV93871.1 indolepyruvate oxidoreductase subunit beta [Candidatus Riflebacteria bacterium]
MTTNILLCGVGGQGTLLASNLLAECAMEAGFDVKKSEIHGMAQRGGSVVSHVRFGEKIDSPIIRKGECDILLSFEELESIRWAEYLKKDGLIITNSQHILPMSVSAGNAVYPKNIQEILSSKSIQTIAVDAIGKAKELGNQKCLNVVLVGLLAKRLTMIDEKIWPEMIKKMLPEKLQKLNLEAFQAGRNIA